jgi:glycosyltransferase involved in cell wall biosynthesis
LFLAYYFPPLGGAGVQRSVKFARYLVEFGYDSVIVTGPEGRAIAWSPPDESLASEVPPSAQVHRVGGPEPGRRTGWRGRLERWCDIRPEFSRWWIEEATAVGLKAAGTADLIYASMSPFESGEAAARLAREAGKPWVADLRDPWALDEWIRYPTRLHRRREMARMRRTLGSAAAIVMNTPEATLQLARHFPELGRKRLFTIPNGFDAADFSGRRPRAAPGEFRIVHAGYVHTSGGLSHRRTQLVRTLLGGSVRGLDILARSHVYLLEAVDRVLRVEPGLRSTLRVDLIGLLSDSDREGIASDVVRVHGYLPHDRTITLLRSAHLLFLPMYDLPVGTRARIVPGKTYEYLATGNPILAAVPDGDARDLLERAGTAFLCRPRDVGCMARVIASEVDRVRSGAPGPTPRPEVLGLYERRHLTERLAGVFDLILDGTSARRADLAPLSCSRDSVP